ncbi:hypothetical protein LINPERPRIM_LOCUS13183 [Linum perenne]
MEKSKLGLKCIQCDFTNNYWVHQFDDVVFFVTKDVNANAHTHARKQMEDLNSKLASQIL